MFFHTKAHAFKASGSLHADKVGMDMKTGAIFPDRLRQGDAVGIVAPASPFDRRRFDQGLRWLESAGYHPVVPEGLFDRRGYLAGSDKHRADLVNRFFMDNSVNAIVCARGGYGSMRMLPFLDYDAIRRHPKILAGFSDITALLNAVSFKSRLVTFHGPNVTTLGDRDSRTRDSFVGVLAGGSPVRMVVQEGVTLCRGRAAGIVTGGNLTTLCHLTGTPFEPDYNNCILLLEDRGEAPYRIDRMLSQMKMAGCFDNLAGIVLGSFEQCGTPGAVLDVFREMFGDFSIPVLDGLDAGHGMTNLTVPIGLAATLDADRKTLTFDRAATGN